MKELEEYKKKVEDALEKEKEVFDKFNDVCKENEEYVEKVLIPNNGRVTPEQKLKEHELVEKVRKARKELDEAIDKRQKL